MLKDIVCGVKTQVNSRVLNQENITELALTAFFAGGHVVISGQGGLGKTVWAKALAKALGLTWGKERFYNDLQPSEMLSKYIMNHHDNPHRVDIPHIFLAKAIGYAHPRVQTVITDAMDKKTATIEGKEYPIPEPFFIVATQEEGQSLPDCLSDRFMLNLSMPYPGIAAEKQILQMHHENNAHAPAHLPVCNPEAITLAKEEVLAVAVDDAVFNYIISVVETTRRVGVVSQGPSPRGSIALLMASKAYAAIQGRDYVTTEDVRKFALPVLRHRLKLKPHAVKEGVQADQIIEGILAGRKGV